MSWPEPPLGDLGGDGARSLESNDGYSRSFRPGAGTPANLESSLPAESEEASSSDLSLAGSRSLRRVTAVTSTT